MERLLRYFHLFICLIWLLIVDQNAIWAERPQSLNFISKSQFTMWPKKPPGAQEPFLNRWPTPNKIPPTIIQTAASLSSAASSWVASCVASNSCSFPKKQRFLFEAKNTQGKTLWHLSDMVYHSVWIFQVISTFSPRVAGNLPASPPALVA